MSIVTVSAAYGAGGAIVGPQLAERLEVPFLDRAIPSEVAERLAVPLEEASLHDDQSVGGLFSRVALRLAPIGLAFGAEPQTDPVDEETYFRATEAIIREHAAGGSAVILGRGGALVLKDDPRAFHVRLDGPREKRIEQAMRLGDGDREDVEQRLDETDRAREAYVKHFYHADARECEHYHLVIDATAMPLDAVVDMVVLAAGSRTG